MYRTSIKVIDRAVEFANERTGRRQRFGGPAGDPVGDELLRAILPTIRGAVSSERARFRGRPVTRTLEFVSSREAPELVTIGAACPDHLVHTKRVPLWVPYDPASDDVGALRARIAELAERYRIDYRAYVEQFRDADTVPGDPDARVVLIQRLGLVAVGTTTKAAKLSRNLSTARSR